MSCYMKNPYTLKYWHFINASKFQQRVYKNIFYVKINVKQKVSWHTFYAIFIASILCFSQNK